MDILGGTYTVKCGLKLEGELLRRMEWTSLEGQVWWSKVRGGIVEENGVVIIGGTYTVKCGGLKLEGGTVEENGWTSLEVLILSSVVV